MTLNELIETFIDGLKREQIEKLFENIEDGTKALKKYLEKKRSWRISNEN